MIILTRSRMRSLDQIDEYRMNETAAAHSPFVPGAPNRRTGASGGRKMSQLVDIRDGER
jgi:hypothetical protein